MTNDELKNEIHAVLQKVYDAIKEEDRGLLANLRRGLIEGRKRFARPYWCRIGLYKHKKYAFECGKAVATWLSDHQGYSKKENENLGEICLAIMKVNGEKFESKPTATEKRFMHVLDASRDELIDRVTRIVKLAKSKGVAMNYEQLWLDLIYWGDAVKDRWAASFWASEHQEDQQRDGVLIEPGHETEPT